MRRFYVLLKASEGLAIDPVRASQLEVEWWRAEAMDVSDRWVEAGRDVRNPLPAEERALLVRSFAALLAAVHR
jgi:hypothetical protein